MKENKIITDIKQLTPEWLTSIFKNKGYLSQGKVTKIIKKKSQETVSSNMHFLELSFSTDAQTEPSSPEIAIKIPKSPSLGHLHAVKFYNIVAENMIEMPIPTCYDAAFSEKTRSLHIIFEDVSKTFDIEPDFLASSKSYLEKAIDCLAELHAFWWDHKKLKELSKHSYVFYNMKENSFDEEQIFKWFRNQNRNLKRFLKLFGHNMSANRKTFIKTIFSLYPQVAYERIIKKNITVIHTDAHIGNFFYPKDAANPKSKAILIDWDLWGIGVGCQDLAYMIGLFFYSDYRQLIEKDLIKRYHNHLVNFGIKNYNWDDCWYDYKLFSLLNLYRIIWWWNHGMHSWTLMVKLESSISTIEDLNCMELIESKE